MPREVTMAVIAVVMALMFPAFASRNDNRGSAGIYQLAQYCVPQYDEHFGHDENLLLIAGARCAATQHASVM